MVIPRLLVLALLSAASTVPGTAQSSSATPSTANPYASQWPQNGVAPPLQFGPQVATPPFQLHLSPKSLGAIAQGSVVVPGQRRWMVVPGNRVLQSVAPQACYAIRSYNFSKQDPGSDATRFTGSSTCQLVSSAKLKAVVDPRVVVPR